ncbi:hypothetical protein [uncultured Fibrobacter sp.]|uniref:hypothetical protein n=1 Tax=uncultured Fibrobacter sp. TaxID=261512 RepID=UPI0025F740E2|nr:hypothetical protein [uncultured Fibrobacter sp.]
MKRLLAILFVCALTFAAPRANAFTMDVQGGIVNAVSDITSFNLNVFGHIWFPIDQMVFFGIGSGYNELDNVGYIPVMASAWVRLPIGGQTLPVVTGDIGYAFGDDHQMIWRAGGGFDIKNGDYSSILLMGGYQFLEERGRGYVYLQAGILVEL